MGRTKAMIFSRRPSWGAFFHLFFAFSFLFSSSFCLAQNPSTIFSTDLSAAQFSASLMNELMGFANQSGLEGRSCNLNSAQGVHTFDLSLLANDFSSLKKFHEATQDTWKTPVHILGMTVKPNYMPGSSTYSLTATIVLAIAPTPMNRGKKSIFAVTEPLSDLPFFSPLSATMKPEPHLFSFTYTETGGKEFQVVTPQSSDFTEFLLRPKLPSHSRTFLKSQFQGKSLFTMDFSENTSFVSSGELLAQYNQLADLSEIHELRLDEGPGITARTKIVSRSTTNQVKALLDHVARKMSLRPVQIEFSLAGPGLWNMESQLARAPVPPGDPSGELDGTLSADWPPSLGENLKITWTPSKILVTADTSASPEMAGQSDLAQLKEMTKKLGFTPESARKTTGDNGEPRLVSVFSRMLGAPGPASSQGLRSQLTELFGRGEILEDIPTEESHRYLVRLPFPDVQVVLDNVGPGFSLFLREFHLSCRYPEPALARMTFAQSDFPQSKPFLALVKHLAGKSFPWNQSEDALKTGLIVQEINVKADSSFEISGTTLKSSRIFSHLFPALQALPGVGEPFFREGNYRDHPLGRLMTFQVTGKFQPR